MAQSLYSSRLDLSSGLAEKSDGYPFAKFDTVSGAMRRRQSLQEILNRRMTEAGVSPPEIVKRAKEKGVKIGKSTVNDILLGEAKNPGIYTVEAIALGLNLSPEQFAAEILGGRTDDPNFKGSQFALLNEIYKSMTPTQRLKAESRIEDLLFAFQRIKSQK